MIPALLLALVPAFNNCAPNLAEQHAQRITICMWPMIESTEVRSFEWNDSRDVDMAGYPQGVTGYRMYHGTVAMALGSFIHVAMTACQPSVVQDGVRIPVRCIFPITVSGEESRFIEIRRLINGVEEP